MGYGRRNDESEEKVIEITYKHICDGCQAHLGTEVYECIDNAEFEFPKPHRMYSFIYSGLNVHLCRECATPMYEAVELMKEKVTRIRAIKEARGK